MTNASIKLAGQISRLLMDLSKTHRERWNQVVQITGIPYPFGDVAYAAALLHWRASGKPAGSFFSYAPTEMEDPFLLEFCKELEARYGLPILSKEEGVAHNPTGTNTYAVKDWGPN